MSYGEAESLRSLVCPTCGSCLLLLFCCYYYYYYYYCYYYDCYVLLLLFFAISIIMIAFMTIIGFVIVVDAYITKPLKRGCSFSWVLYTKEVPKNLDFSAETYQKKHE